MTHSQRQSRKIKAARLSIFSNSLLVVFKLAAGIFIGSVSVMSEAIHSGIDLVAAGIAYFAVRSASQPADREHQYGHGKFENISGFIEAILIFVAAAWIIFEAVKKLISPVAIDMVGWGIFVMAFSSFVNLVVSGILFKAGKETDSIALTADAWHLRTDVYTSLGVMGGLGLIWLIERLMPGRHVHWIDPLVAIIVAVMIIKAAYELTMQSIGGLLDESLPQSENDKIHGLILSVDGIKGCKNLHTRKAGATRFVEADVLVDGCMTVDAAHALTDTIGNGITAAFDGSQVLIHVEPCTKNTVGADGAVRKN